MPVRVVCPSCNKGINVPEKLAGTQQKCPGCKSPFLIPALATVQAEPALTMAPDVAPSRSATAPPRASNAETTLLTVRPSMFRNNPVGFVIAVILIPVLGLGLAILLIWWFRCHNTTLTVTNKRTSLRTGIISKHTREVRHTDVRFLEMKQGIFQRMMGVGTLCVSSAGQGELEIEVGGIPNPQHVKDTIDGFRP